MLHAQRVPLATQIHEVQRELAMRDQVYPNMVKSKRMSADGARMQTAHMRGVLRTLLWLERNEALIRSVAEHVEAVKAMPGVLEFLAEFPEATVTSMRRTGT
jgi:hypothetical protein